LRTARTTRRDTHLTYIERVNLAIDFMVPRLSEPLNLHRVAKKAMLSPYHFHRVFQAITGETPADFVKRLRLEKAIALLAFSRRTSITSVALTCGFASPSDFSRSFKLKYGVAPRSFDIQAWRAAHGEHIQRIAEPAATDLHVRRLAATTNPDRFRVRIRELPAKTVAYIRVLNPYQGDAVLRAYDRLMTWATRHNIANNQWYGYQWENPEVTALADCHYHVAVEAPAVIARGEIGRSRFPAMLIAEIELDGGIDLELRALQYLYGSWLPRSRYVPADQPCFEAWIGRPFAHGMERFTLRAQLPVKHLPA
jgi:AraC family transcriptional regulator